MDHSKDRGISYSSLRLSLFVFAASAACIAAVLSTSTAQARPRDSIAAEEAVARIEKMRMPTVAFPKRPLETAVDAYDGCVEYSADLEIPDPAGGASRKQTISIWVPEPLRSPRPAVVVVPTIEGRWFVEDRTASWLCSDGNVAVIADVNDTGLPSEMPDWGFEDRRMRAAMLALQTVLDWAASDPRVDASKLGAVGVSLGGITAALWAGIEPRLKAGMIVAGGGNLPEILALSTQAKIAELRAKRIAAANLKDEKAYEEELHKAVLFDPIYVASLSKARLKMVTGTSDDYVPLVSQESLWEALGRPDRLLLRGESHVGSIITWAYWHMGESVAWMKAQLTR